MVRGSWRSSRSHLPDRASGHVPEICQDPDRVSDSRACRLRLVCILFVRSICEPRPELDQPPAACDLCILFCACPDNRKVYVCASAVLTRPRRACGGPNFLSRLTVTG